MPGFIDASLARRAGVGFVLGVGYLAQSFIAKVAEWGLSLIMLLTGWGLLAPGATYNYSSGLWRLLQAMPETWWGLTMVAIGLASLWALLVNGAKQKITSRARIWLAIARSAIWLALAVTFIDIWATIGQFRNAAAIYPVFVLMDWAVIVRASGEHRDAAGH